MFTLYVTNRRGWDKERTELNKGLGLDQGKEKWIYSTLKAAIPYHSKTISYKHTDVFNNAYNIMCWLWASVFMHWFETGLERKLLSLFNNADTYKRTYSCAKCGVSGFSSPPLHTYCRLHL